MGQWWQIPPSLGSYATIPKAKRGGLLDKTKYKYLDAVHIETMVGDCVSVGRVSLCTHFCCATSKKVINFHNLSRSVSDAGYIIPNFNSLTLFYNDNDACVKWSYNMTLKAAHHIKLCENSFCEWVQDKTLQVEHVSGKVNPEDIFTKEMHDGAHFRHVRDS